MKSIFQTIPFNAGIRYRIYMHKVLKVMLILFIASAGLNTVSAQQTVELQLKDALKYASTRLQKDHMVLLSIMMRDQALMAALNNSD